MEINHKFENVEGVFDTNEDPIVCMSSPKYQCVDLCFKANLNIPFAQIKLYSGNAYVNAEAVFDDARRLGEEIARRWNASRDNRQHETLNWAQKTFGNQTANNTGERIARFAEEALELAQAAGMDKSTVLALVDYVFSRPVGEIKQEMGGVGISLLAYAEHIGISANEAEHEEFIRVTSKDAAYFQTRQNAKAVAGIGLPSTSD